MESLIKAIKDLHGCNATYLESIRVKEEFEGQAVWEGTVHIYNVDHQDTNTCYAWSSPVEGSKNRKFYTVLKLPPVKSVQDAVKASIVSDYQTK